MAIKRTFGNVTTGSITQRRGSYALRAAVALTLAMAAQASFAGPSFVRRTADPAAQAANVVQQQAVGAAQATQAAMRSLQSFNRLKDVRQNLLTVQEAARAAAQATSTGGVANGLQAGGLQVADDALTAPISPTLDVTKTWSGANAPTQTQANGRTQVEIVQTDSKAILTWNTFNVGRETDVHFNQTAGGDQAKEWIALNRVTDPNLKPSTILGSIKAEGQVYLINTNGILFGATSQVNVHSLIASSLDVASKTYSDPFSTTPRPNFLVDTMEARNAAFRDGILFSADAAARPRVAFGEVLAGDDRTRQGEVFKPDDGVTVLSGARLAVDSLGSLMLFGHNVSNAGDVSATNGQVILAAGRSVYLARNDRDVVVTVGSYVNPNGWVDDLRGALVSVDRGGVARNDGIISSPQGNITLTGKEVVNAGLLAATTGARANGSIRLLAGDFTDTVDLNNYNADSAGIDPWFDLVLGWVNPFPQSNLISGAPTTLVKGQVHIAPDSAIVIVPDGGTEQVVGDAQFRSSRVEVSGLNLSLDSGSWLWAPGARVNLAALPGLRQQFELSQNMDGATVGTFKPENSRIYLDRGALVDLSGLDNVQLPMESNTLQVDWRLNELRDSPVERNGFLHGKTVPVDVRYGDLIANLSAYYALRQRGVSELMTVGGTLKLDAQEVIARIGSTIDLSGGSVQYLDGYAPVTRLMGADGRIYNLATASPNALYTGFAGQFTEQHARWGISEAFTSPLLAGGLQFQSGYVEGKAAGQLIIGSATPSTTALLEALGLTATPELCLDCLHVVQLNALHLDGDIVGSTVVGPFQTQHLASSALNLQNQWRQIPQGASLVIDGPRDSQLTDPTAYQQFGGPIFGYDIRIGRAQPLPANFAANTAAPAASAMTLSDTLFTGSTFSSVSINTGMGALSVDEGTTVQLGAYGQFAFYGNRADIFGTIKAPNGQVNLQAREMSELLTTAQLPTHVVDPTTLDLFFGTKHPTIWLGATGVIDVSGRWVNDLSAPSAALNGGTVSLAAADVLLAKGSRIDVSGGGQLSATGHVTAGDGGVVNLFAGATPKAVDQAYLALKSAGQGNLLVNQTCNDCADGQLSMAGDLVGYALGRGATLSVRVPRAIHVTETGTTEQGWTYGAAGLTLSAAFFNHGGFSTYSLSTPAGLTVSGDGIIAPQPKSFIWNPARAPQTGQSLYGALDIGVLDVALRGPSRVSLTSELEAMITVATGAQIRLDPLSEIDLTAQRVLVDGIVEAPGGTIAIRNHVDPMITLPTVSPEILLGPNAQLLARGYFNNVVTSNGVVRTGYSGGTVTLNGGLKSEVSFAVFRALGGVFTDLNSVIDVSGVAGVVDALAAPTVRTLDGHVDNNRIPVAIGTDAGSVAITLGDVGFLAGEIAAHPGAANARGGAISIATTPLTQVVTVGGLRFIDVNPLDPATSALFPHVTVGPATAATKTPFLAGTPLLLASRIRDSGADSVSVHATSVSIDSSVELSARRELLIAAPLIGVTLGHPTDSTLHLTAPYVRLGPELGEFANTEFFSSNVDAGQLRVDAGLLDLNPFMLGGQIANRYGASPSVNGFASTQFNSSGDIRLIPGLASLTSPGELIFSSAQTYVAADAPLAPTAPRAAFDTLDGSPTFTISGGTGVHFHFPDDLPPSAVAPVPYSVGGTLYVVSPIIEQAGILRAPQGRIILQGGNVVLAPGSLTSTSLENLTVPIPLSRQLSPLENGAAAAGIKISGNAVNISAKAVVDLSGGGDVAGYAFLPGNGGSNDILTAPGIYAVLPGYQFPAAPVLTDLISIANAPLVGQHVYLSGSGSLPAGDYVLLPAHYALLPGGFAVQTVGGGYAQPSNTAFAQADGSSIVSGYQFIAGTSERDTLFTQFRVMPQATIRNYSQFDDFSLNAQARLTAAQDGLARPRVPGDGGTLILNAQQLQLQGTARFDAPQDFLPGTASIIADRIAVLGAGHAAPVGDYLTLSVDTLNAWQAGSLTLGAQRSASGGLDINASEIFVANDASSALHIPELLLAARDSVEIADGSVIEARANGAQADVPLLLTVAGSGAALLASNRSSADLLRSVSDPSTGVLRIGANAKLDASGTLVLDTSASLQIAATAVLNAAAVSLASNQVSLGAAPANASTAIASATLASLAQADDLRIRSYGSIDFYGEVTLGARDAAGQPTTHRIVLDTPGLNGYGGNVVVAAKDLVLSNQSNASASSVGVGTGSLNLQGDELQLGAGAIAISGFANATLSAARVTALSTGALTAQSDLTLATDLLSGTANHSYAMASAGALRVAHLTDTAQSAPAFGAQLNLSGQSVFIDSHIDAAAGILNIQATHGSLSLGAHAQLTARGVTEQFFDVSRSTSGGRISLSSQGGDLLLALGSLVDVSATSGGSAGGQIELNSDGNASFAGALSGAGAAGAVGGEFTLRARSLDNFTVLNRQLESGGFTTERSIIVAQGDLALAAGETLTAHRVHLESSGGSIAIGGSINARGGASSADGGQVALVAGNAVDVLSGALIDADAASEVGSAFPPQSGLIDVQTLAGTLDIHAGATLRANGGLNGGGIIALNAPRTASDVQIAELGGVLQAREVLVRGTATYSTALIDASEASLILSEAATWMNNSVGIAARLGSGVSINPGVRVVSTGDLTISAPLNLNTLHSQGQFEFVAANDVHIGANVSDGFSTTDPLTGALSAQQSSTLRFSAGRDLLLNPGSYVRTGTGNIALSAGRDILLGNALASFALPTTQSQQDLNWAVYTAGRAAPNVAGFTGNQAGEYHPLEGGALSIAAGRDIVSPVVNDFVSAWQYRHGLADATHGVLNATVVTQTSWSIVFSGARTLVGALGGGNVDIRAARDVRDLQVALPTTGQQSTAVGHKAEASAITVHGGGNLRMEIGRDLFGGVYTLGRGAAEIRVGNSFGYDHLSPNGINSVSPTRALFALSDASLNVQTREDLSIDAVLDPMMTEEVYANYIAIEGLSQQTYFSSYTDRTAVMLTSVAGDLTYVGTPSQVSNLTGRLALSPRPTTDASTPGSDFLHLAPGRFLVSSLQGGLNIMKGSADHTLGIAPEAEGTLELVAAGKVDIVGSYGLEFNAPGRGRVEMLGLDANYWPTIIAPFADYRTHPSVLNNFELGVVPLHRLDRTPARIYSRDGDVLGGFNIPKVTQISAGRDLLVSLTAQNNDVSDQTVLFAGRDIRAPQVTLYGPGRLDLIAGRDVDFSFPPGLNFDSPGIHTVGNGSTEDPSTSNLALPRTGADISIIAGLDERTDATSEAKFAITYLDPQNASNVAHVYLTELRAYLHSVAPVVESAAQTDSDLIAAFAALPETRQMPFLNQILLAEVQASSLEVNDPKHTPANDYRRGQLAVERLYPQALDPLALAPLLVGPQARATDAADRGNVLLNNSTIETKAGGNIAILTPYGRVGLQVPPGNPGKNGEQPGGILTRRGGTVDILANGNIDVVAARIFTLQGGNMLLASLHGDVTAGAGGKAVAVNPPPKYTLDKDGNITLDVFGLQTGSGIGVLDSLAQSGAENGRKREPSRLDFFVPEGTVDAGEAGIRVKGDINIAALHVANADNIQVTGKKAGIPEIAAVNTAALAAAANAAASVSDAAEQLASRSQPAVRDLPSIITVEVLGFGDGP